MSFVPDKEAGSMLFASARCLEFPLHHALCIVLIANCCSVDLFLRACFLNRPLNHGIALGGNYFIIHLAGEYFYRALTRPGFCVCRLRKGVHATLLFLCDFWELRHVMRFKTIILKRKPLSVSSQECSPGSKGAVEEIPNVRGELFTSPQ